MLEELVGQGKVVGGELMNGTVSTTQFKGDLVIQAGLKRRRLTSEQVASWEELTVESRGGSAASTVGKAVAGAVLPGLMGKVAGAAFDVASRSGRTVRIDWNDGKQSLIRLPEKLFTHLSVVLKDQQVVAPPTTEPDVTPTTPSTQVDVVERGCCTIL